MSRGHHRAESRAMHLVLAWCLAMSIVLLVLTLAATIAGDLL